MNYIYDIVLNFNKEYYNFFEWNKKDNILNVKKIPYFLVNDKLFYSLKYNKITLDMSFIELIRGKTLTYSKYKANISCLVTNKKEVLGLLFNDNGELVKRSSLLVDEEEEVLNELIDTEIYSIPIIKNKELKRRYVIRSQKDKMNFLINYINKENNIINLKYLYYDYYEKEEDNILNIKNKLLKEINNNWNSKLDNLCSTVEIFNKIKN